MRDAVERIFAWSERRSLTTKLAGGFAAVIALSLLVGAASFLSQDRARKSVDKYFDTDDRIADLCLKSNTALLKARKSEKDFLLKVKEYGFDEAKSRYVTQVRIQIADIRQNMTAIRDLSADREVIRMTREVERSAGLYEAGFFGIVELYGARGRVDTGLEGRFRDKAHEIEAILSRYQLDGLLADLMSLRRHEKDFLMRGQDRYVKEFAQVAKKIKTDLASTGLSLARKEQLARLVDGYRDLFGQYVRVSNRIINETTVYHGAVYAIEPTLEALYNRAGRTATETRGVMRGLARISSWVTIFAGLGAVLLGIIVSFFISRSITHSVRKSVDFAGRISRGDLDARMGIGRGSEFDALAVALNGMADALQEARLAQERRASELAETNKALEAEIDERRRTADALYRANRIYRMLSACNTSLVRATAETGLVDNFCRNIAEIGGYPLVWVGYENREETNGIYRVVQAIHISGCPGTIGSGCANPEKGRCTVAESVAARRDGDEKTSIGLAYGAWLVRETPCGCAAAVAFPLTGDKGVFGALHIHAAGYKSFQKDEVELFNELAGDLAFGINSLRSGIERQRAEEALRLRQRAIESSNNGIMITGANAHDNPIIYVNPAFERITGYAAREVQGRNGRFLQGVDSEQFGLEDIRSALREQHEGHAVLRNYRKDGSLFWNELSISPVRDDGGMVTHFVGIINDITEQKHYEEQLEYQANHDALTDLPNRNLLADRIRQALFHAQRHQTQAAVLFIDLDHFKLINDSLGHNMGDRLLKISAERITECVRSIDTVARQGGDEFVVIVNDLEQSEDAAIVTQKIMEAVSQPFSIDEHELEISCSIGISIYPKDGDDGQTILKNADAAMYRAKEQGRNNFQFYTKELNEKAVSRMIMEKHLRRALEGDEFLLHYQPQVDLNTGNIFGMEALIRWQSPELGFIPPDRFISLAEETGLIVPIGEWVLKTACAQNKAWQDAGLSPLTMAVNLSPRQFRQENLAETMARVLQETGLGPQFLELEITESLLMHDVRSATVIIRKFKELGAQLTMDDFGTGYSSLSYLKLFPFDKIKIDQSFVREITSDPDSAAIANAIIALAHSLKLRVIAEGIETEGQMHYLRSLGCDEMQGFYFSRPVPAREFEQMLLEKRHLELKNESDRISDRTLLLVDDEADVILALKRMLSTEGYHILTAESAKSGFELLAVNQVGVIVADQCMPGVNGIEFLSRAKELHPDTVRILLTGYAEMDIVTDAINRGAIFKFLIKPWDDESLRESILEAFKHFNPAGRG